MSEKSPQFLIDAHTLHEVLEALQGPTHLIRELQVTRGLGDNPIDALVEQYNGQAQAYIDQQEKGAIDPKSIGADQVTPTAGSYTCIGKGGDYELVALALPSGELREASQNGLGQLVVYRDAERHFVRTLADFNARMEKVDKLGTEAAHDD